MKEIRDIICAYDAALSAGKKTALATVVHVEGSSYRRPGARMLVTDDGVLTGAISGGCLEGDALRKALLAIRENRNKLVTYDTTDEDDARFGVQLGCNGIVHILFEPLNDSAEANPIDLLKKIAATRQTAALTTFFSLDKADDQLGTVYVTLEDGLYTNGLDLINEDIRGVVSSDTLQALSGERSLIKNYLIRQTQITALIQVIVPSVSLVIFGAGNDAIPLAAMGRLCGWLITVIDGRPSHATVQRFPDVDKIIISRSATALTEILIDKMTVFVLMTHNYNYDIDILRQLSQIDCSYIGILGPKKKLERMFSELSAKGVDIAPENLKNIYSPVGLDIGAETAEEIALSIAAEIKSILYGINSQSLRSKIEPIHNRDEQTLV